MIQLVGQHAFRNLSGDTIDVDAVNNGIADARRKLGQLVHEPSLADLSEVDRTFLTAMSVDYELPYMREYLRSHPATETMEQLISSPKNSSRRVSLVT